MTSNEGTGLPYVAGGTPPPPPLHVPWSDPKPKTVSITWPSLTPPPTQKEAPAMTDLDIHGEPPAGWKPDPPAIAAVPTPPPTGINPLPAWAIDAARLLADTEKNTDPTIRSARRIAAQALEHLRSLTTAAEALTRSIDNAVAALSTEPTAKEVRAWARTNNIPVPDVGRVPAHIYDQYKEAH